MPSTSIAPSRRTALSPRRPAPTRLPATLTVLALIILSLSLAPLALATPLNDADPNFEESTFPTSHTLSLRGIARSSLIDCLTSNKGLEVVTPDRNDSAVYHDALVSHNANFEWHPLAIVYPRDEAQIAHALSCANEQKGATAVAARSGSCSFAAFGTGGMDGSLVIDMMHFDFVKVLPATVPRAPAAPQILARIGPAVRLGGAVKELWAQGKRGIPHGTCPQVGMGGHALCGGFGPLSRHWGLTTDNVVSMDVFLANGTKVVASATENKELFWGMRGAGAKLGIVSSFTMMTHNVAHDFTNFAYTWTAPSSPITSPSQLAAIADGLQDFAARRDLPSKMGLHLMIHTNTPQVPGRINTEPDSLLAEIRGMYAGPAAEFKKWGDELLKTLIKAGAPAPGTREEEGLDYLTLLGKWDDFAQTDSQRLDVTPARIRSIRGNFWARTHLTLGQKGFRRSTLERAFGVWFSPEARSPMNLAPLGNASLLPPNSKNYEPNCFLELFGGSNSAVRDFGQRDQTAFAHRDALWLIQCSVAAMTDLSIQESGRQFLFDMDEAWRSAMADDGLKGASYSCYVDATLEDWREKYYGEKTMRRLEILKRTIDPFNVVRNPHSILRLGGREGGKKVDAANAKEAWVQDSHPMP